ncbi:MAG: translesion DNA synthesis-associated protein ImuA, partial [Steroidobacteraceae bacterium]
MSAPVDLELARLLEHPAIWRGRSAARTEALASGYAALDACLPGKGWPRTGLIEILVSRFGVGELYLLFPALAALTCRPAARWCVWIAPPLEPYAPAFAAHDMALERVLVVRAPEPLWAFEQTLGSGASDVALAWATRGPSTREIRRLQLAAERGKALGVLFRPQRAARESSAAVLRI